MMEKSRPEPRERILDAAVSLFAQKGYGASGVRKIAEEAQVNLAMISYYFDGKLGILKAIMEKFFQGCVEILADVNDESRAPEECVRTMISRIVHFVRMNTDLTMVMYNELPLENPEITEQKARMISSLITRVSGLVSRFDLDPDNRFQMGIIGPSLISMIFANFRMRPVLSQAFRIQFDDAYHERLVDTISTLFLHGVTGLTARDGDG